MARSSRHKSHRSHKHRGRSESDDEGNSRERKMKVEEEELARVSRVSDQEKRKSSSKDGVGTRNGDVSLDHGRKRKDRGEDSSICGDRWNGGGDDGVRVEKESKKEESDAVEVEKSSKSNSLALDLKGKSSSSRRLEGPNEKNEEKRSERSEERQRPEKATSRRESSSSQYKDGKEKEKEKEKERERERERGSEKEKKAQDSRHERSEDAVSRKVERYVKQGVEISDLRDEIRTTEVVKELDKRMRRRRDGSGDQDRLDDVREGDDRQVSSRDDHSKNGSYKDGRYKEKYREELDRNQRHHDDKHSDEKRRDERSSRTHTSERSESKHYRDESRVSGSRDKKTKLQDSDRDGSRRGDDHSTKLKDNMGRKRSSDEIEDQSDMKPRSVKEPREDTPKSGSSFGKFDSCSDRARMEHPHIDKVDSSLSNSRTKNSPNSSAYAGKDQNRHNMRPVESTCRELLSEDTRRSGAVSRDHAAVSGGRERMSESRTSDKAKSRDNIRSDVYITDSGSVPHHDRILRSDAHSSPNKLAEKSPTSTSERRSDRITARRSLDIDEGGLRSSSSKGGRGDTLLLKDGGREREYMVEKSNKDDTSQAEFLKREHVSIGSFSNRSAQLHGSSPGRLPPPPPVRYGVDSPSVLGSYEDETRVQNGERKVNNRYKRDVSLGRGPGTPWKGAPTWPSPVANGFMPLPHGPGGFLPAIQHFPAPRLFGIRPSMELSNASYHIHEAGNRFPGHTRSYGWHNPVDDCPQLQVWDGNTSAFRDESHIYGRQEWDQSRHMLGSSGWEMSTDMWNAQNGNANMDFPITHKENEYPRQALADEAWVGQPVHNSHDERARSEQPIADASEIKLPSDTYPANQAVGASLKSVYEKMLEPSNMPCVNVTYEKQIDNNVLHCRTYLSKLEISRDLVQPELYKQCMSLMEVRERNVLSLGQRKCKLGLNVEGFRLVAKSKEYASNSFLPTATDATFQRAMALYRKQREGLKEVAMMHLALPSVCFGGQNNPPESNDEQKVAAMSVTPMEVGLPANAISGDYMDKDNNAAADVEGEHLHDPGDTKENLCVNNKPSDTKVQQVSNLSNAEEKGCAKISDAVISVEGSEESEAIIPECRVNLSRIHLSPAESTH